MHKHYLIITFTRTGKVFGFDTVDASDVKMREILKKVKQENIPFTHRVWFSQYKDIQEVLKEKSCVFQDIIIVKDFDDLIKFMK